MLSPTFLPLFLSGIVTGTVGAMLGLGGGVFLVPFLVLVFGLPMHQAIATSLVAVIATSSAGAAMNIERQTVNLRFGMLLEVATVAGAILGGLTANYMSGDVLKKIFSVVMLVVAVFMIRRARQKNGENHISEDGVLPGSFLDEATRQTVTYTVKRIPAVMVVSLLAGNLSGLLGVGGGFFKVPAMHILSGIPIKAAAATSNFMIGVTAAGGFACCCGADVCEVGQSRLHKPIVITRLAPKWDLAGEVILISAIHSPIQ
ncbi:MAG: sulfite exporter TauE/SafE family protein [Ignavibacteriales bacterium]|nr:sulfite exporter TauE/SafE family protein [Ignavibacteriales bacterium]